jgi:hypothetical protein
VPTIFTHKIHRPPHLLGHVNLQHRGRLLHLQKDNKYHPEINISCPIPYLALGLPPDGGTAPRWLAAHVLVVEALELLHVVIMVAPDHHDECLAGGQGANRSQGDPSLPQDGNHRSVNLKRLYFPKNMLSECLDRSTWRKKQKCLEGPLKLV